MTRLIHALAATAFVWLALSATAAAQSAVNICVLTQQIAASNNVTSLDACANISASAVTATLSRSSTVAANLRAFVFNETDRMLNTTAYQIDAWGQTVLVAYLFSLPPARKSLLVRLTSVTVSAAAVLRVFNRTDALPVVDIGGASLSSAIYVGYLFDLAGILKVQHTEPAYNLLRNPAAVPVDYVLNGQLSGFCVVTYPNTTTRGFYGAVYKLQAPLIAAEYLTALSLRRRNNLRVRLNATVAQDGTISIHGAIVDDAATDTPVPVPALPNGVTPTPVAETTVMSWYIYLMIGLGVVGVIGIFACLAKRASLRREDVKKTARHKKRESDRFDKIAHEMRSGIPKDDNNGDDYY